MCSADITATTVTFTATRIVTTGRSSEALPVTGTSGSWIVGHVWSPLRTNSTPIASIPLTPGSNWQIVPYGTK
ncbi:unnamed protein product [Linum tenue]|uniref:Uncharacterized protein n=1 Tax=Linum tenue TaxID=586396 RepID=A0AAV0HJI1_9ROSI|nr:unnamed protein product [Linum tenue]